MLKPEEIENLQKIAAEHDGHCDKCGRVIKIYHYKLNSTLAGFLRAMERAGVKEVNIATLGLSYSVRTQITKLRLHGLVARVKTPEGTQKESHWLITRKGFEWLSGASKQETVIVFDNQVIGHEGGEVTIHEVMSELPPEAKPISTPEAEVLHDVRTQPVKRGKTMIIRAQYVNGSWGTKYLLGEVYDLEVAQLQLGKPVIITKPHKTSYRDIAAFQTAWKVLKSERQKDV